MRLFLLGAAAFMLTLHGSAVVAAEAGEWKMFRNAKHAATVDDLNIPDLVTGDPEAWQLEEGAFSYLDQVAPIGSTQDPEPAVENADDWEQVKAELIRNDPTLPAANNNALGAVAEESGDMELEEDDAALTDEADSEADEPELVIEVVEEDLDEVEAVVRDDATPPEPVAPVVSMELVVEDFEVLESAREEVAPAPVIPSAPAAVAAPATVQPAEWELSKEDFNYLDRVAPIGKVDIPEPPAVDPNSWEMVKGDAACADTPVPAEKASDPEPVSAAPGESRDVFSCRNSIAPARADDFTESEVAAEAVDVSEFPAEAEEVAPPGRFEYAERAVDATCRDFAPTKSLSVGVFVGAGDERSVMYELFLKKQFRPFWSGSSWALSPLLKGSAFGWSRSDQTIGGASLLAGLNFAFGGGPCWRPYAEGAVGPALISSTTFGDRNFSTAFQFRSSLGLGVQFGNELRNSLEVQASHFSNACIKKPNDGYNSIGVAYGFAF